MNTRALPALFISASLAVLLLVGFLTKAEPITAVNPVPCATLVPVATATPDGGPTYTPTLTHTPCLIKLTSTPTPTPVPPGYPAMSLRVTNALTCNPIVAGEFCVGLGQKFDVIAAADEIPPDGYILSQVWIDYDGQGLVHNPDPSPIWPDLEPQTYLTIEDVTNNGTQAGGLTGLIPPQQPSFYVGDLFSFSLTCTTSQSSSKIQLLPFGDPIAGTSGTAYFDVNIIPVIPALDGLIVNCVPAGGHKLPHPGDTDGDGCSDWQENGSDETKGGLRNWKNHWDFYDVLGEGGGPPDQIIDLPNDILGVILRFAPLGLPPYDVNFDRGVSSGPNVWNMTAPDGVIDLPNDILGVILQFDHDCR